MKFLLLFSILFTQLSNAQVESETSPQMQILINQALLDKWYERIQLKGYTQFRYNRLAETNRNLKCPACDKSVGDRQNFFLRRARISLYGDLTDRVYVYIQPDYASDVDNNQNYLQIRDAYFDYATSSSKEIRIRTGISKVPFGFANLQSSSSRAPLDRDESLNSGVSNERDIGLFVLYSPASVRDRFKALTKNNLKGTGDYGMVAVGAYNGQTLNKAEKNNDLHRVIRVSYPYKMASGQFIEASLQAYEGKFNTNSTLAEDFYDQRSAASLIYYPQPFGFQLEYNTGKGPEYDPGANKIKTKNLKGGYAQLNYQIETPTFRYFPYVRFQQYQGGRKIEAGAPAYDIEELELGIEWQPNSSFELTTAYSFSERKTQSLLTNRYHEKGQMLRLQAQFNY